MQPPTYSPLSVGALARGLSASIARSDPRTELTALLHDTYGGRVVLCSSGTDALTRAIRLADVMTGDSHVVALPAYGCFDLATAAVGADVRVTLYDLDPDTLAPDLASVRESLTHGARVVVCAPYYGLAMDWAAITALANEFGAILVEDAAQACGATWRGRPVGSLGDIAILSFGRGKGWTGSHGGALLVRGAAAEALEARVPSLLRGALPASNAASDVVTAGAQFVLGRPTLYSLPASLPWLALGETRYHEPSPSAEMSRAAAAMLLASRQRALSEIAVRRATAAWYDEHLKSASAVLRVTSAPDHLPGYLRYPVRLPGGLGGLSDRRRARALGIGTAYPSLLGTLGAIRPRLHCPHRVPGAARIQRELVTLPTHSLLTAGERDAIAELLASSTRRDPMVTRAGYENLRAAGAEINAAGGA